MKLSVRLATQIAVKTQAILDRQMLVADTNGYILAGLNGEPVFNTEALNCAQTGRQITSEVEGFALSWWPFVYEDQTLCVFGLSIASGPLTPEALSLIQGLAEVITYQYFLVDRMQSMEVMRSNFIREALTTLHVDTDDLHRRADILQLNLRTPQAAILIQMSGFEEQTQAKYHNLSPEEQQTELIDEAGKTASTIREGLGNNSDDLVSYLGRDTFLLIKVIQNPSPSTHNTIRFMTDKAQFVYKLLQDSHQYLLTVAIGQYYPGLDGLRKSYRDARLALEVGSRVWEPGQVYHIKQVGMFITLTNASQERKAELAYQILSPLLDDDQLFKTVRTFLAAGLNLTEAAEQLHIHRNTLIYRLDKTKKLIGLDPRIFDDALQIKLGLMFYQPTGV